MEEFSWFGASLLFVRCFSSTLLLPIDGLLKGLLNRLLLSVVFSFLLLEHALGSNQASVQASMQFSARLLLINVCVGFMLTLPGALLGNLGAMFSELFDGIRGQSLGASYDPLRYQDSSVLGLILSKWLWLQLLLIGYLPLLLLSLDRSFRVAQLDNFEITLSLAFNILTILKHFLSSLLYLLAPFAVTALMTQFLFGVIAKVFPAFPVFQESFLAVSLIFALGLWCLWEGQVIEAVLEMSKPQLFSK